MFPDLRLLISATVVTFFLAATAGLYASLRVTQDQIATRNDSRGVIEDSPIARISASWPAPEPGRTAALWELTKIAKSLPVIASDESADAPERGDIDVPDTATPADIPAATEVSPAQEATGSTGIAVQPEAGSLNAPGHPDIAGNIGEAPEIGNAKPRAGKTARPAVKKVQPMAKKKPPRIVQRRKQMARTPDPMLDPLLKNGYPLYLTVPITN
jgi:hypothetical protein